MTREELLGVLINDPTQYCCYCGEEKVRFSCCGEVHFQTFAEMPVDEQEEFLESNGMQNDDVTSTVDVSLIKENEDGSAVYQFNFPPNALAALTRLGILTAIQAGIGDAKKLEPEYNPEFTDEIKELAEDAGFCMWRNERYKPDGEVVDWASNYDDDLVRFYHLVKQKFETK